MPTVLRGSDNFDSGLGLGVGQTWQNVAGSRVIGTTYTNTTGRPIAVLVVNQGTAAVQALTLTVGGVVAARGVNNSSTFENCVTGIVPVGATYVVSGTSASVTNWSELR